MLAASPERMSIAGIVLDPVAQAWRCWNTKRGQCVATGEAGSRLCLATMWSTLLLTQSLDPWSSTYGRTEGSRFWGRGDVTHPAGRLEHHRAAALGHGDREVRLLGHAQQTFVERTVLGEDIRPDQDAVELVELGGTGHQGPVDLDERQMVPGAPLRQPAAALPHGLPQQLPSGMVDDVEGFVLEGEGTDGGGVVHLGAGHQSPEPARGNDHVVVDEDSGIWW
jgi:hypothetical protein